MGRRNGSGRWPPDGGLGPDPLAFPALQGLPLQTYPSSDLISARRAGAMSSRASA
jgi:hypothetical protein